MKVCVLADWFYPAYRAGGPVRSLYELVRQIKDVSFWVVTRNVDYTERVPLNVPSDRWVELFPNTRVTYLSRWTPGRVTSAVEEVAPDVVYINSFFSPYFSVVPLWRLAGKWPIVLAPRGMLMPRMLAIKRWRKYAYLWLFRARGLHRQVFFHATSTQEAQALTRLLGGNLRLRVIPNPVSPPLPELPSFSAEPCGRLRLLYVGRIAPEKNLLVLLRALYLVEKPVHLTVFGSIYSRRYWQRCLRLMGELHRHKENVSVVWAGAVPFWELRDVLAKHQAVVVPSLSESFGHIIYEALAAATPVVISSGCAHWQTPFVFPPDDEGALAHHLNNLAFLSQEEYHKLRKEAYRQAVAWWQKEGTSLPEKYKSMFADARAAG